MYFHFRLGAALIAFIIITMANCRADTLYTYITNPNNPIYEGGTSGPYPQYVPPGFDITVPDYFTLSFVSPFTLAPNSTYNISVQPSATEIPFWVATDTRFAQVVTGLNAPISLVPAPGLIEGGELSACGSACFGGAVQTDQFGDIVWWNLLAAAPTGYSIFFTFNTPGLGFLDGLGSTQDGYKIGFENTMNGPEGTWVETPLSTPLPTTFPLFATGLGALGLLGWRRKRKVAIAA